MKSSLIALIVVLIIPPILNLINPKIFQGVEMQIPKLTVKMPGIDISAVETSEINLSDEEIEKSDRLIPSIRGNRGIVALPAPYPWPKEWKWSNVFKGKNLSNIRIVGNDPPGRRDRTEYVNPVIAQDIINFNKDLKEKNLFIKVTDGYSIRDHKSEAHTKYGTAIDIVVTDKNFNPLPPNHENWGEVINIAKKHFNVLDEREKKGSEYWSGSHLHLFVKTSPGR